MPVNYRVWVAGFAEAERESLARVFARRSLIAYAEAASPDAAELWLADADRPQALLVPGVPQPDPRLTLYLGDAMPPGARWHVPRPADAELVLRTLDELVAREKPAPHRLGHVFQDLYDAASRRRAARAADPQVAAAAARAEPVARTWVQVPTWSLPDADDPVDAVTPGRRPGVERRAQKVSRRAEVRRAQLAQQPRSGFGALMGDGPPHALVLDGHAPTRVEAGVLLTAFGFRAQAVATVEEAERALWSRPFAVAFLGDSGPDGSAEPGIALCHRIKHGTYGSPVRTPKVVVVARRPRPADPVRARLAGCDHFVGGEATRGALAMALEAVDVPMPRDPRGGRA